MGRPNSGKTRHRVSIKIHTDMFNLLEARRDFLVSNGQKFASRASMAEISKEFTEHYLRECNTFPYTSIMSDMKKSFKKVSKSAKNL